MLWLAVFAVAAILAALNFSLAWIYVNALVDPGCAGRPAQIPGAPTAEEVQLQTIDGLLLRAWYYPSGNRAVVIALGGTGGALGDNLPHAGPLIEQGYGVLQIDSRACASPPKPVTLGYHEADDAAAGLVYLTGLPEIDPHRIGLLGFSMGGVAAIRAAARHPQIAGIVAEGGYYNLGGDIVEAGSSQPLTRRAFLYSIAALFWLRTGVNPWMSSPIDDLPVISPRPVFLIYGENELADARVMDQFAAAREPKELWIVPGGSHGGNHKAAPGEYPRRIIDFFNNVLLSTPER